MITPLFNTSQDDEFVTVELRCPYVKAREIEFFIDDTEFKFFIAPYFLRLNFPFPIVEDGRESAKFDIASGVVTVKLPKLVKGQHFPDLEMLSKLMIKKPTSTEKPKIEVFGGSDAMEDGSPEDEDDMDWEMHQELPVDDTLTGAKYGFNNSYSGFASHIEEIGRDIIDIKDLNTSTFVNRRSARLSIEEAKFNPDYYMCDFINDDEISRIMRFKPESWQALMRIQLLKSNPAAPQPPQPIQPTTANPVPNPLIQTISAGDITPPSSFVVDPAPTVVLEATPQIVYEEPPSNTNLDFESNFGLVKDSWLEFTAKEREDIVALPLKEFIVDNPKVVYLGLVDLVFAYCYDVRTTDGEHNVESSWTVAKLSPTLSCFENFSSLREVVIACIRRSLIFPLYRNWGLAKRVLEDTAIIFKLGRRAILKCLLAMRSIFRKDDDCYIFDRLFLEDYCIWCQVGCSDKAIKSLASELNHLAVQKEEVGLDLVNIEETAKQIQFENNEAEEDSHPQMM
ncbi:Hsp90 cochaperone shq1 [Phlyctochytrium planicorne]|nr:Hsp90 cochaperone shq1 [Phlyctochytrium planicorne]